MSGICSTHQGHDPECKLCTQIPLTEADKQFYAGMDFAYRSQKSNCWTAVENCVLNKYTILEEAARKSAAEFSDPDLEAALKEIDKLRELHRGMWGRDLEQ